jgi:predicted hotdog family 3-hydroxylacyl-ACP dehydratase
MRAIARIPGRSPFRSQRADKASAPAVLALEMAAQAAAVFEHETVEPAAETHGLLVGVRDARFHAHELSADADFEVEVELHGESSGLREWSFSVRSEGALLAEGTLLTYLPLP